MWRLQSRSLANFHVGHRGSLVLASSLLIVSPVTANQAVLLCLLAAELGLLPIHRELLLGSNKISYRDIAFEIHHIFSDYTQIKILPGEAKTMLCRTTVGTLEYNHCSSSDFLPPCHNTGFYGYNLTPLAELRANKACGCWCVCGKGGGCQQYRRCFSKP